MNYFILALFTGMVLTSCSVSPKPIEYGTDVCHYCSMTIVDQQHAAEVVTKKGRDYKFDAIECMVNHMKDIDISEIGLFLINDYADPGKLIDATSATYLISPGIPSPMGADLSGFAHRQAAQSSQEEHSGEIYSWKKLLEHFKGRKAGVH